MESKVTRFAAAVLFQAGLAAVLAGTLVAQEDSGLAGLTMVSQTLSVTPVLEPMDGVRSKVASQVDAAWASFELDQADRGAGAWSAYVDSRSGRLASAEGGGIPWIPGRGNRLTADDISGFLRAKRAPDLAVLEDIARRFVDANAEVFGVDSRNLELSAGRSGPVSDHLWFVDFDVMRAGIPIEGARVVFRVSHGNLIQFGTENVPPAEVAMPPVQIDREQAFAAVSEYVGGIVPGQDLVLDAGSLHLLPTNGREGFELGEGYGLASVWEIKFRREGESGTWRARVDATSGQLLEFQDVNHYAQITGGVILSEPTMADTVRPMPFTDIVAGVYTNSSGRYVYAGAPITTTLDGQYVRIADDCGPVSETSNTSGDIPFGASSSDSNDCKTPSPTSSPGNTRASRTVFYWLNRIKEIASGWSTTSWLQSKIPVETNLPALCDASWDGITLRFHKAQAPSCVNSGHIPGIALHEFGHGLDANDGGGMSPDRGTAEAVGDITAALALRQSCIGSGFSALTCDGFGNACNTCRGARDIDWAKHAHNPPTTVANFIKAQCPRPTAHTGPCGRDAISRGNPTSATAGHCESLIISEAMWDFVNRDHPTPGTGAAWTLADRLWYMSRLTASQGFTCDTSTATWTSNGCNIGSLWRVLRAMDDDNGNLNDGTPHGGALYAAFDRHGIACPTDPGANTTFAACTPPARPTITLTPGNSSATISWTSSGSNVVYDIFRNESGCTAGFARILNNASGTSFKDGAVANLTTYYYQVVAQPTGNEACSSVPSPCVSVISKPDLTPTPITYTPASPEAGNVIAFDSGVSNAAVADSGTFNVKWFVDGVQVGAGLHGAVPGNTTVPYGNSSLNWTATAGTHTIVFQVDADGTVPEVDENNNKTSITITVSPPRPDLTPTEITLSRPIPTAGDLITFDSGVKNLKPVASGPFNVRWLIDGVQVFYGNHAGVPGGSEVANGNSQFSWRATEGSHTVTFSVDVDNGIAESNEGNNSISKTFTVVAPLRPDLAPTAINMTPASPESGDVITFDSGVANQGGISTGAFNVKWFVDGVQKSHVTHAGVPARTTAWDGNSSFSWTATEGSHRITFSVDVDNGVTESNEENNSVWRTITVVAPRPDLTPTAITFNSADLVRGRTVDFDSGVQNLKPVANYGFHVKWFVDGVQVGYGSHAGVPGNTTVLNGNSQYPWVATAGTHTITFLVDADFFVAESNETNNSRSITVTVP